jgi:hypothetical protein
MLGPAANSTISSTEDEANRQQLLCGWRRRISKLSAGHACETEALSSYIFF